MKCKEIRNEINKKWLDSLISKDYLKDAIVTEYLSENIDETTIRIDAVIRRKGKSNRFIDRIIIEKYQEIHN